LREASAASGVEIKDDRTLAMAGRKIIEKTEALGVIVTRGREGSALITEDRVAHFPVKPVEIIDVTGAGDTVIATLAVALGNDLSIDDAISLANLAGSLVVSRFGAATVTLKEMAERLNEDNKNGKIFSIKEISAVLRSDRIQGKKIVFTNGCFDLLHAGHLHTLRLASKLGDILVVGINSDISVKSIKGEKRPIIGEKDRMELVAALEMVDYVAPFDEDTPTRLIREVAPDILVKGEDWRGKEVAGSEFVSAKGGRIEFVTLKPGCSTTDIIADIKRR
jgi:D-beta-D-heptose 7-phosphate kinase/D-beta-D-heptose 1-phosphate adenosyltransferase